MRRFVKSTISDLGLSDYSEWFIGHEGSTYYRRSEKEKLELFYKIQPYLTFLDQTGLETKSAEMSDRLETVESQNRELRANIKTIMEMIQQNPQLAHVKPEVLTRRLS